MAPDDYNPAARPSTPLLIVPDGCRGGNPSRRGMHRSIAYLGAALLLVVFALITYPLWAHGIERFDVEQELGILFLPAGLLVLLAAGVAADPRGTTVGGAFGNPEFAPAAPRRAAADIAPIRYHPREPVTCAQCGTVVAAEAARCPRCGRARPCRRCGRPLGWVLERPTCPRCGKAEAFCDCPVLPRPASPTVQVGPRGGRR